MLLAILILPLVAELLVLSPPGRRWAAAITLASAASVFGVAVVVALRVAAGQRVSELDGALSADGLSALYLLLVAFVGLTASLYSWGYIAAHHGEGNAPLHRQYYPLFNLFLLSLLAVPLLSDVILIWIAIDLTTLFSAFLVAYDNKRNVLEAAWKYVVLTTMGAMIALLGIFILVYGLRSAHRPLQWQFLATLPGHVPVAVLFTAFLFILVGFGAKAGLVPMHTWLPDAHSQAPAPICALLSGVETTAPIYFFFRLFPMVTQLRSSMAAAWFIVPGLISVAVAALLLIQVRDFKRLFAFSTVEHMGILMVACGLATPAAHLGAVYQMAGHSLTKSFCFFAAGLVVLSTGTQEISAVRGLIHRSPVAGFALLFGALGIAGAPPFAIFSSEVAIVRAGLAADHYVATSLLVLFIVIAFCAILYHVLRMCFGDGEACPTSSSTLPTTSVTALAIAAVPVLLLGIWIPMPLVHLVHAAAAALGGPR